MFLFSVMTSLTYICNNEVVVMVKRIKIKPIGLALLAVVILTACGQKRGLHLPEEPVTNNTPPHSEPSTESGEQGKN